MKKVSIIVPIFNGEKYIEQTVNNILNSAYRNIELVLVDDGSTDKSFLICKRLMEIDERIVLYTKKNEGVDTARNFGVMKATGDYFCFCDQDDIVERNMYDVQATSMDRYQSDFCMCSTGRSIRGKRSAFELFEDRCYEGEQINEELLYPLLFNGYNVPVKMSKTKRYPHIWSCMFRREFFDSHHIRFRTYINYEDDLLVKIEALSKAVKVSTVSYIGYYWRVNLNSESYAHKYVENMGEKQQKCYEDMVGCIAERISDQGVIDLFTQITFCKQYLDAVHNLTSPFIEKNYGFVQDYYKTTIYSRNFEQCINARKYIKRGRVKPGIILPVLSRKMTMLSYFMEIVLDYVLLLALHSQILAKIERCIKKD